MHPYDKKIKDEYYKEIFRVFRKLKKDGNLNPRYKKDVEKTHDLIQYFDFCRNAKNLCENLARRLEPKIGILKKYGITDAGFKSIYSSVMMYNFLVLYSNIENLLLDMLKGVKYGRGKNEIVNDKAGLTTLLKAIDYQFPNNKIPKDILDVKFRNALAHTWYKIENNKLTYYENSLLAEPKNMSFDELELMFHKLNIFGNALGELVIAADWN